MGYQAQLKTPFGMLGIRCDADVLTGIEFLAPNTPPQPPRNAFARKVCEQLSAYLADPDFHFSLPLRLNGTTHQTKVWQAMCAIPRGETRSYGELAAALQSSAQAVGQACGANPIPIVIPCHRVVGKAGLGGFMHHSAGYALGIKRWLLVHEATTPSPSHPQGVGHGCKAAEAATTTHTGEGWGEGESVEPPPLPQPLSDRTTDITTSHLTRLPKDASQVIGYSHSTRPSKNKGQVAGYRKGRGE